MKLDLLRQNESIYFCNNRKCFYQSLNKKTANYLDRKLHTRGVVSPVMMWIHICARGVRGMLPRFVLINGAIWCILCVLKYVIIKIKINIF